VAAGLSERFRNLRSEGRAQVGALMAAVTYWFVHSSVDWFWQMPAITLPAIVYLAMLVSPWRVDAAPEPLRLPLRAGGIGVAVLALMVIAPLYLADRNLAASHAASDPEPALAAVERARGYNPLDPRLPKREAELAARADEGERAEASYKLAIQLNPRHYAPYVSLAEFYQESGRSKEALRYYQRALTLNPLDHDLRQKVNTGEESEPGE
jgi:tetratricopeptide (TPR) repeat protein